jgi:predicted nucleic acid-binding protein
LVIRCVVDASVVVKCLVAEELSAEARRLVAPNNILLAPALLPVEVANVLATKVRRGLLLPGDLDIILEGFPSEIPIWISDSTPLLRPAIGLAISFSRSVYDSLYIALALREDCPLVTADRRLFNAMQPTFPESLMWVGDLPALDV